MPGLVRGDACKDACRELCLNFQTLGWSAADVSVWLFKGLVARVFLRHEGAEMRQERKANGDGPYLLSAASQVCLPPAPAQETSHEDRASLARRRRHPARRTRAPRADARGCAEARAGTPEAGLLRGPLE